MGYKKQYSSVLRDSFVPTDGRYKNDDAIILVNQDGDYALITYLLLPASTDVIVPHMEALNMPATGTGVSYLLLYLVADKAIKAGRTHMTLGTAVFRGAAGHVYNQLGFDTSSAEALSNDRVALSDIKTRAADKIKGKWSDLTEFDEIYIRDRRRHAAGLEPELTSFPKI